MSEPLSWEYLIDAAAGGIDVTRVATAEECRTLAEALQILACRDLHVTYTVTPRSGGRFRLRGHLDARVEQACVVSLEPVPATISEAFDVEFRPEVGASARRQAGREDAPEADATILDEEDIEPIRNGRLQVGRVVYDTIATALDPFPRAEDAALDHREAGAGAGDDSHPFAGLARLKPKG